MDTIFFVNRIIISNVRIDSRIQVEKIAVAYSEVIHKEDGDIPNFLNICKIISQSDPVVKVKLYFSDKAL